MQHWGIFTTVVMLAITTAAADVTKGGFGAAKESEPPKKAEQKPETANKTRSYPFYGTLDSVDVKEKTMTLRGKKKNRVILFTSKTRFTKDGAPANFQDGVAGERVSGSVRKNADGKEEAITIRFGTKSR
jgi:hypothetical protein